MILKSLKIFTLLTAGSFSACSSYYHSKSPISGKGQTEFVDAKQRAVLVNPIYLPKQNNASSTIEGSFTPQVLFRMCSEPSPDVFSVYALALTGNLNASLNIPGADSGVKDQDQLKAAMALASSETGSTIERTQTINLIRESMYRTCERYLSGAIDDVTMNIQAARDQRAMVAILAIEQLTGVVKRQSTILSSQTQSTMVDSEAKLVEKYLEKEDVRDKKMAEYEGAKTAYEAAQKSYNDVNIKETGSAEGKCELIAKGGATPPNEDSDAENTKDIEQQKEQCTNLKKDVDLKKSTMDSKKEASDEAEKSVDQLVELLENIGQRMSSVNASGSGSGDKGTSRASVASDVTKAVARITDQAFSQSTELIYVCANIISKAFESNRTTSDTFTSDAETAVINRCFSLLDKKVNEENKGISLSTQSVKRQHTGGITLEDKFEIFWRNVASDTNERVIDYDKFLALVNSSTLEKYWKEEVKGEFDKGINYFDAYQVFKWLNDFMIDPLVEQAQINETDVASEN